MIMIWWMQKIKTQEPFSTNDLNEKDQNAKVMVTELIQGVQIEGHNMWCIDDSIIWWDTHDGCEDEENQSEWYLLCNV